MDAVEQAAFLSVGRASGFAALAIVCFMIGFSYDPLLAARIGASLSLLTALVLAYRSTLALSRPYRKTETWLILEEKARPPKSLAQKIIGSALREAYAWYGRVAALATMALGSMALALSYLRAL
jgi:multisubunit Na+/H+ antiporter MnhB subunit